MDSALAFLGAAEMRLGQQLAEVLVTGAIFYQHRQDASILHRQFHADDRSQAVFAGGHGKSLRAVNAVAVEQRHGRHLELGGSLR